jgi:hypothetical protein
MITYNLSRFKGTKKKTTILHTLPNSFHKIRRSVLKELPKKFIILQKWNIMKRLCFRKMEKDTSNHYKTKIRENNRLHPGYRLVSYKPI